ncbi:uncharacterized protein C8Q71DRAFT_700908, partial [Rhodofomes roseus]
PDFIFFDNACKLKKHIDTISDHHFDNCALPVDVFHMNSNHKGSDALCGFFCNPMAARLWK